MRTKWALWLNTVRTGFWFAPMLMLILACGLALLVLYVDERLDPGVKATLPWAYSGGPEGARSLLSTIAGSMITAASVTFSLASVALSIASQQYGSRVLRNFMRDRITQVLLGTFVSTFIYSVLVVRAIRGTDVSGGFVPAISVTFAIGLSLASLILLIYFIHHVSRSIQASRIVEVIAEDIEGAIPRLYPASVGRPADNRDGIEGWRERARMTLPIPANGYLLNVDLEELYAFATAQNVFVELLVKPGDHLISGDEVARVWGKLTLEEAEATRILDAFSLGGERTPLQDIRYQFQQLTDVVIRALSPGINDPFTAINGIDQLASGMELLLEHARVCETRKDDRGILRLLLPTPSVVEVLEETVGHIGIYAAGDRFVMAGLRRVVDMVDRKSPAGSSREKLERIRQDLDRRENAKAIE